MKLTEEEILHALNDVYNKEERVKREIRKLLAIYEQLQENKEFLQTMYMFQKNKQSREKRIKNNK